MHACSFSIFFEQTPSSRTIRKWKSNLSIHLEHEIVSKLWELHVILRFRNWNVKKSAVFSNLFQSWSRQITMSKRGEVRHKTLILTLLTLFPAYNEEPMYFLWCFIAHSSIVICLTFFWEGHSLLYLKFSQPTF